MSTVIEFGDEADIDIIVPPFTGTARGKQAVITTATNTTRIWIKISQTVGPSPSGDGFIVRFMGGTDYHTLPPEGGEHVYSLQTPSTEIRFVLGYSGVVGAYADNFPIVEIFELCE